MATAKLETAVTFEKAHRHFGVNYVKDDVGLVTEKAAEKLARKKVAKVGGDRKKAKNLQQATAH